MKSKRIIVAGGLGFIGANYMEKLIANGEKEFINLDYRPPRNGAHRRFWADCDIRDAAKLKKIVKDFAPHEVAHLAAKTGMDVPLLSDFSANMGGNLIAASPAGIS